jgi:hypothetical protein
MSVLGVLVLNLLFLLAGSGILWGVRGWTTWREWASLGGIAYMSGLAAVSVLATLIPIYGGGLSAGAILALVAGVGLAGVAIGVVKRRPFPVRAASSAPIDIVALVPMAVTAVLLVLFFRVARLQPMTSWDAWSFWMTKAKAIYYFGGIDTSIFRQTWPSYPLLVPVLAAMNFRFMAAADTTALGVQWWLLAVGLVWAVPGLLRRLAPPRVTWLFLALFVALPQFDDKLLSRTADWPLDVFFALAACAALSWVVTQEAWRLAVFGLALSALLVTKREGQLLALCVVVATLAAAGLRRRATWAWVVGVAVLAYLPAIPWRIWWTSRHLPTDEPPGGILHATFSNLHYAPRAFGLVAGLLFDYRLWLAATPLAIAAAAVCLGLRDRRVAIFFLVAFVIGFVGWSWENWAFVTEGFPITRDPSLNPTIRTVASLVLLSIVTAPVLLGQLLAERAAVDQTEALMSTTSGASATASTTKA